VLFRSGQTKADVFENAGLNPISVESGKGKVQMRFDKIHSDTSLVYAAGIYKFKNSENCERLVKEFNEAVHSDTSPGEIAR